VPEANENSSLMIVFCSLLVTGKELDVLIELLDFLKPIQRDIVCRLRGMEWNRNFTG